MTGHKLVPLSTTSGSCYSYAKDVRCQPSPPPPPHQGCAAANILGGQYCNVVITGDELLRHPPLNGDGPARNSGDPCGQTCQKRVHLARSYWNANVGAGVKTASVCEHTWYVLHIAHAGEIVTIHKALEWVVWLFIIGIKKRESFLCWCFMWMWKLIPFRWNGSCLGV